MKESQSGESADPLGVLPEKSALAGFYDFDDSSIEEEERQALTPILNLLEEDLKRYEIDEEIGRGAEKRILRVYDRRLGRHIAMAKPVESEDAEQKERFLREARLTASVSHPYILPIHNMGLDSEGIPFFTMELLPPDRLADMLEERKRRTRGASAKYTLEWLLNVYVKVCDAIAYAHLHHIIHLDLKPSNIWVGEFGGVVVCDWGLARVLSEGGAGLDSDSSEILKDDLNDMTLLGTVKGTPGFMAPEQITGSGVGKDRRTDIYALGAILYMVLTGHKPIAGSSSNEIIENTLKGKIIPPSRFSHRRNCPRGLVSVALKAMALEPNERYQSVPDLLADIRRYMQHRPTVAERAGLLTQVLLFAKRHIEATATFIFLLIILSVGTTASVVQIARERAVALRSQKTAEANLNLFLEEQETANRFSMAVVSSLRYAYGNTDYLDPGGLVPVLDEQLSHVDSTMEGWDSIILQKATVHFYLQEFNEALALLEMLPEGDGYVNRLRAGCEKMIPLKPDDNALLQTADLVSLLSPVDYPVLDSRTVIYTYLYHQSRQGYVTPDEYFPIARIMLDVLNGSRGRVFDRPIELEHKEDGYYLDLSHRKYTVFRLSDMGLQGWNILGGMRLRYLDVSYTSIMDVNELGGSGSDILRIVGLSFHDRDALLRVLKNMDVKKVIIDVESYPDPLIAEMRKHFEVVNEPFQEELALLD